MPTQPTVRYIPMDDGNVTKRIETILSPDEFRAIFAATESRATVVQGEVAVLQPILEEVNQISPPVFDDQPVPSPAIPVDPL